MLSVCIADVWHWRPLLSLVVAAGRPQVPLAPLLRLLVVCIHCGRCSLLSSQPVGRKRYLSLSTPLTVACHVGRFLVRLEGVS